MEDQTFTRVVMRIGFGSFLVSHASEFVERVWSTEMGPAEMYSHQYPGVASPGGEIEYARPTKVSVVPIDLLTRLLCVPALKRTMGLFQPNPSLSKSRMCHCVFSKLSRTAIFVDVHMTR